MYERGECIYERKKWKKGEKEKKVGYVLKTVWYLIFYNKLLIRNRLRELGNYKLYVLLKCIALVICICTVLHQKFVFNVGGKIKLKIIKTLSRT